MWSYVTVEGLFGDYNDDGQVDLADYTVWRNNLGASESILPSGSYIAGSGTIDTEEYSMWKSNFGATSPTALAAPGSASVPEPATWAIGLLAVGLISIRRLGKLPMALVIVLVAGASQIANATTDDRLFRFGEGEGGSAGNDIAVTWDDAGVSGAFLDLLADDRGPGDANPGAALNPVGAVQYANDPNRSGLVGSFDGNGWLRSPYSLNAPTTFWNYEPWFPETPSGASEDSHYPLNYDGIWSHGIQSWIKPEGTALTAGGTQDIVVDTPQLGIYLSEAGNWGCEWPVGVLSRPWQPLPTPGAM